MDMIKFYSEYDLACGGEIDKIIERINKNVQEEDWTIANLKEFYNILKYISINRFAYFIWQPIYEDMID